MEGVGVPLRLEEPRGKRIACLLFADDLVWITPSRRKLVKALERTGEWVTENEMKVGTPKCGVMVIGKDTEILRMEPQRWCIGGQPVPIVDSYKYLGINFHKDLQVKSMMSDRLEAARKLVAVITPFLRCASIPLPMKVTVVRGVVVPKLLFGAEVYGMNKALTQGIQVYLNQVCRLMLGMSAKATVSSVALWSEIGIPPICASAAARRARALQKAETVKTYVSTLVKTHFKHRCWTWATGTHRWLQRYAKGAGIEWWKKHQRCWRAP